MQNFIKRKTKTDQTAWLLGAHVLKVRFLALGLKVSSRLSMLKLRLYTIITCNSGF